MNKDNIMLTFAMFLTISILINTVTTLEAFPQSIECDNNFGDCGTPEQSGGGGGGKGSVLIANTDLGDTYQHADDYDDDGIEDPSDNCVRTVNPDQLDRDGDGRGDACDNCLEIWNASQENIDGDEFGDYCDDDIDNDQIKNVVDECPYHYGNSYCFEEFNREQPRNPEAYPGPVYSDTPEREQTSPLKNHTNELDDKQGCCQTHYHSFNLIFVLIMTLFVVVRKRE